MEEESPFETSSSEPNPAPPMPILEVKGALAVPWVTDLTLCAKHPSVRFHNEILEYCNYISPSPDEIHQREAAIER
jgi:hypothetical protein